MVALVQCITPLYHASEMLYESNGFGTDFSNLWGRAWRTLSRHLLYISTDCIGGTSARAIGCGPYDVHGINMNGRGSGGGCT